jgi:hypothetical protein
VVPIARSIESSAWVRRLGMNFNKVVFFEIFPACLPPGCRLLGGGGLWDALQQNIVLGGGNTFGL